MNQHNAPHMQAFVESDARTKANLRHHIQQLENQFRKHANHAPHTTTKELATLCNTLSTLYDEYNHLLPSPTHTPLPQQDVLLDCTPQECYARLLVLQQRFIDCIDQNILCRVTRALQAHYKHLSHALTSAHARKNTVKTTTTILFLLEAQTAADWLNSIMILALEPAGSYEQQLTTLAEKQLLQLTHHMIKKEFLDIIHAVFFYKLSPEALFPPSLHPEKLLSIKKRLSSLYDIIEHFYQCALLQLHQYGIHSTPDYLLHSEALPQGIKMEISLENQAIIQAAVKSWCPPTLLLSSPLHKDNPLRELVNAYKFWFNPSLLIDVIMVLGYSLPIPTSAPLFQEYFNQKLTRLYPQLTTENCIDLYGYFSNKDTQCLLHTLSHVAQGAKWDNLPNLSPRERNTIGCVYQQLRDVMEALREELATRSMTTQPYVWESPTRTRVPRKCIQTAILRIVTLYHVTPEDKNSRIEQLFHAIEQW